MKVDKFYHRQARDFVDMLFDKGFLASDCSRHAIRGLEKYIGYLFQTQAESAVKCSELVKSTKEE